MRQSPVRTTLRRPAWIAAVFAAACSAAPEGTPSLARPVVELARWQVVSGDEVLGQVVQYEIRDPAEPQRFYRIQDSQGRWIGHASALGRFSRRVPFRDEEEDLGVWPMAGGVARLLDASAPVMLRQVAVDATAPR